MEAAAPAVGLREVPGVKNAASPWDFQRNRSGVQSAASARRMSCTSTVGDMWTRRPDRMHASHSKLNPCGRLSDASKIHHCRFEKHPLSTGIPEEPLIKEARPMHTAQASLRFIQKSSREELLLLFVLALGAGLDVAGGRSAGAARHGDLFTSC